MNPVIETIKKRRTIRAYQPKPIPRDVDLPNHSRILYNIGLYRLPRRIGV